MFRAFSILAIAWSISLAFFTLSPGTSAIQPDQAKGEKHPLPAGAIKRLGSLEVWAGDVGVVAFSPDDKLLAVSIRNVIQLWDVASGKSLQTIKAPTKSVRALAFSLDGKCLVSSAEEPVNVYHYDKTGVFYETSVEITGAVVWDVNSGKKIRALDAGGDFVAFSPDGAHLILMDSNRKLARWWDAKTWTPSPIPGGEELAKQLSGTISAIAFSPDGQKLMVSSTPLSTRGGGGKGGGAKVKGEADGGLHALNLKTGKAQQLIGDSWKGGPFAFTADGKQVVSHGDLIRVWDLATGKPSYPFGNRWTDNQLALVQKGNLVACIDSLREAFLGDLATKRRTVALQGHQEAVTCLALSSDGKILVTGGDDGTALLWNAAALKLMTPDEAEKERNNKISVDPARRPQVKALLTFSKKAYFLGESIGAELVFESVNKIPFTISEGGNYRFATRDLSFVVTATDELGKAVTDPLPEQYPFVAAGGIFQSKRILFGQTWSYRISILDYLRFENPGTYSVRVETYPGSAEATLRVVRPTPEEARRLVDDLLAQKRDDGNLEKLLDPIYLPILIERVAKGSFEALRGIGGIPTPDATQAFVQLARQAREDGKEDLEFSVVQALTRRLPEPDASKNQPNPFLYDSRKTHTWLVEKSWRAEFAPEVRKLARRCLENKFSNHLNYGAYILQSIGEKDDLPSLMKGFDVIAPLVTDRPLAPAGSYSPPREACSNLVTAMEVLIGRGATQPTKAPTTPSERVLFAKAIQRNILERPKGWEATFASILQDELPYVRELGLKCLPWDSDEKMMALLAKSLLDKNRDVQLAACNAAKGSRTAVLRESLLKVLGSAKDEAILESANKAAPGLLPRLQHLKALVDRIDDADVGAKALDGLLPLLTKREEHWGFQKLTPEQAQACKNSWLRFTRDHEKELSQGRYYAIDDPQLPFEELFPNISRKDVRAPFGSFRPGDSQR